MFASIARIPTKEGPDHVLVRKSKFILWGIIGGFIGAALFVGLVFFWLISTGATRIQGGGGGDIVVTVFLMLFLSAHLVIRSFLMSLLIDYFYSFVVIRPDNIVQLQYTLFFKEEMMMAELYRVLSIFANQSGIIQSTLNFGDVNMKLQNESIISLSNVPDPQNVVQIIEEMKDYTLSQRVISEVKEEAAAEGMEKGGKEQEVPELPGEDTKQDANEAPSPDEQQGATDDAVAASETIERDRTVPRREDNGDQGLGGSGQDDKTTSPDPGSQQGGNGNKKGALQQPQSPQKEDSDTTQDNKQSTNHGNDEGLSQGDEQPQNFKEEIKQDIKQSLKEEIKEEVREELKQEVIEELLQPASTEDEEKQ